MTVKREGEVVTIIMSNTATAEELQSTLDYARALELSANMKTVPQQEVDLFADKLKREWWEKNKSRFLE